MGGLNLGAKLLGAGMGGGMPGGPSGFGASM